MKQPKAVVFGGSAGSSPERAWDIALFLCPVVKREYNLEPVSPLMLAHWM